MVRIFKLAFLALFLLFSSETVSAQGMPMNIDNLTDQQLIILMSQYQLFGLSDLEMDMKAREKGLSTDQITLLKKRISLLDPSIMKELNSPVKSSSDPYEPRVKPKTSQLLRLNGPDTSSGLKPFGASLFENADLSFEPNLTIATPQGYVIGVGDQLEIDVFGVSDLTKKLKVTSEGTIRFPNLGPVKLSGLTVEDARLKMNKALTKIYPGIANGSVSVQISVSQIRTIQVSLIGEIKHPGNYTITSLSTLMNALYASGGPNQIGSFRNIELVRNGKSVVVFDLYDFLLKSDLSKNLLLQDGDVIRVNPYQTRVAINGAVKKQALFDVKQSESAADILKYAGGFADIGYKEMVRVYRYGTRNKELLTVKASQFPSFIFVSGDSLVVDLLANVYLDRVTIQGAVYYGGAFGIKDMPTLKDLVEAAKPKEDAYLSRALLRRLKPDLTPEFINFDINEVLTGKFNLNLVREDSIQIYRIVDLREKYFITINGEVNKPGVFDYFENMKVQDLVLLANGYKEGASLQKVEISRRLRPTDASQKDSAVYSLIKEIDLSTNNHSAEDLAFKLSPFDIVSIRKSPIYKEQINVTIEGEVVYPGNYTLAGNAEKISDLLKRAGGLKLKGFAGGAILIRKTYRDMSENDITLVNNKTNLINQQSYNNTKVALNDTANFKNLNKEQKVVGIRLEKILAEPGSSEDLFLLEGDILKVPKELQTIQTFGSVNVPKQIVFYQGISFKEVIRESGMYSIGASKKNSYVVYPNGQVRKTHSFLFIRSYPEIKAGTEIYVPAKRPRTRLSTGELVGLFTSLTALMGVIIVLAK